MRMFWLILTLGIFWASPTFASLSAGAAQRVAKKRLPQVQRCYRDALEVNPARHGVVVLAFRVGTDGKVLEHWLSLSSVADPELDQCILKAYGGIEFPAPGEGERLVRVSMILASESTPPEVVKQAEALLRSRDS